MTEKKKVSAPRVLLGHIAGAHGVRGEVLIKNHTAAAESIAAYGSLSDESGRRSLEITVVSVTAKGVIGRVKGVATRTEAEKLKGVQLYVARDRLPETEVGEFYHADLIGLAAVDPAGAVIGEVVGVANYGAGDLVEIRPRGARTTEFVPMTTAFVAEVDLAGRRIVVVRPFEGSEEDETRGA